MISGAITRFSSALAAWRRMTGSTMATASDSDDGWISTVVMVGR